MESRRRIIDPVAMEKGAQIRGGWRRYPASPDFIDLVACFHSSGDGFNLGGAQMDR